LGDIYYIVFDVSFYLPAAERTPILVTNNMMPTLGTLSNNQLEKPETKKEPKDIGLSIRLASRISGCDWRTQSGNHSAYNDKQYAVQHCP